MTTTTVALSTTVYTLVSTLENPLLLQAHRDAVRLVYSDDQPDPATPDFHLLRARTDPFHVDRGSTQLWAKGTSAECTLVVSTFAPVGNIEQVALASAARTVTTNSDDIDNLNGKGAHFIIDISAVVTDPRIRVSIQGKDPISGEYYNILVGNLYSVVGTNVMKVYPGMNNEPGISVSDTIPRTLRVNVAHTNSDSITYSISVVSIS